MVLPISVEPRPEEGLIAALPIKVRLFEALESNSPWFVKELGEIKGLRMPASAGGCQKVFGHGINQIIHPTPPINVTDTFLQLMTLDPSPADGDWEGSDSVVNLLEIIKARLCSGEACGLGGLTKSSFTVKGNGDGA